MNPKRVIRLLLAAIVLLLIAGGAAIYFPYAREKAALEEFERLGVFVATPPFIALGLQFGEITVEAGGPRWLRGWLGDERMGPFHHVSAVSFFDRRDVWSLRIPENDAPAAVMLGNVRRQFPLPDEFRQRLVPLLLELRSLDEITLDEGLLTDEELLTLHRRFPAARITIRHALNATREWSPPPR